MRWLRYIEDVAIVHSPWESRERARLLVVNSEKRCSDQFESERPQSNRLRTPYTLNPTTMPTMTPTMLRRRLTLLGCWRQRTGNVDYPP